MAPHGELQNKKTFRTKIKDRQDNNMPRATVRRLLYFLLVTLLINAGGWTFNREAVADVFFGGQETVATAGRPSSPQTGHFQGEPIKAKTPCNHWCHAVANFLALFDRVSALAPAATAIYSHQLSWFIPEPTPEGHFRPPRLLP